MQQSKAVSETHCPYKYCPQKSKSGAPVLRLTEPLEPYPSMQSPSGGSHTRGMWRHRSKPQPKDTRRLQVGLNLWDFETLHQQMAPAGEATHSRSTSPLLVLEDEGWEAGAGDGGVDAQDPFNVTSSGAAAEEDASWWPIAEEGGSSREVGAVGANENLDWWVQEQPTSSSSTAATTTAAATEATSDWWEDVTSPSASSGISSTPSHQPSAPSRSPSKPPPTASTTAQPKAAFPTNYDPFAAIASQQPPPAPTRPPQPSAAATGSGAMTAPHDPFASDLFSSTPQLPWYPSHGGAAAQQTHARSSGGGGGGGGAGGQPLDKTSILSLYSQPSKPGGPQSAGASKDHTSIQSELISRVFQ